MEDGRLGLDEPDLRSINRPRMLISTGVVAICAGVSSSNSYVIDSSGQLSATGLNDADQCGAGQETEVVASFTPVGSSCHLAVSAGASFFITILRDATILEVL